VFVGVCVAVLVGVYVWVGVLVGVKVLVGVLVAVLVGVLVGVCVGVKVCVGVLVAVLVDVWLGVKVADGNGVRVFVGNPKLKSTDDAATLLRNVAPVAVNPVANQEQSTTTAGEGTDTGTEIRHVTR
jgi:hypothetical protein